MINVSIPDELAELIAKLPAESRESLDAYLRGAIEDYLWEQQAGGVALKRLEEIRAGRATTITMDEMRARLGLVD